MLKNKLQNFRGFTLVELIVVITIVGILSTVGFVSYSGYLTGARDSNRISQLTRLSDSLQVYSTTKSLPLPDDSIQILASGALVGYQGYVGVDVLETIDYTNGGKDPKDGSYYTYYLTKDRSSLQLLAFMEEETSVVGHNDLKLSPQTNAADYSDRFPKVYGRKLGVLTQVDTNTPAQEVNGVSSIDLVTETSTYVAHITDTQKIEGSGSELRKVIPNGLCKRIKEVGKASGNGIYAINPGGTGEILVYCDMETSGGGWTLVARSGVDSDTASGFDSIPNDYGTLDGYSRHYKIFLTYSSLSWSKYMLATYQGENNNIIDYMVGSKDDNAIYNVDGYEIMRGGIIGGTSGDGFNLEQGMFFIK